MSERSRQPEAKKPRGEKLKQWARHRVLRALVRVGIPQLRRTCKGEQTTKATATAPEKKPAPTDRTHNNEPIRKNTGTSVPGWDDSGYDWIRVNGFVHRMKDVGIPLTEKTVILDIGTGQGGFPSILRKMGYPLAQGLDAERRGDPGADIVGRIEQIPLPDSSVDIITAYGVFDSNVYNQNHAQMLSEINRILKPGGIFYTGISNTVRAEFPPTLQHKEGCRDMYEKSAS